MGVALILGGVAQSHNGDSALILVDGMLPPPGSDNEAAPARVQKELVGESGHAPSSKKGLVGSSELITFGPASFVKLNVNGKSN